MSNNTAIKYSESTDLSDEQKRRLRAVRRGYRAESVEVKDGGWMIEVRYMDGSKEMFNSKMLKLQASTLR